MRAVLAWALAVASIVSLTACAQAPSASPDGSISASTISTATPSSAAHGRFGPGVPRDELLTKEFVKAKSAAAALAELGVPTSVCLPDQALGGKLDAVYTSPASWTKRCLVARYSNGAEIDIVAFDSVEVASDTVSAQVDAPAPRKRVFTVNGAKAAAWSKGTIPEVIEPGGQVRPGTGVWSTRSQAEWRFARYQVFVQFPEEIDPKELVAVVKDMRFSVIE